MGSALQFCKQTPRRSLYRWLWGNLPNRLSTDTDQISELSRRNQKGIVLVSRSRRCSLFHRLIEEGLPGIRSYRGPVGNCCFPCLRWSWWAHLYSGRFGFCFVQPALCSCVSPLSRSSTLRLDPAREFGNEAYDLECAELVGIFLVVVIRSIWKLIVGFSFGG